MPSLWSGSISFGLVSIPVRLEVSQSSQSVSFNLLHKTCLGRIKQKQYCPQCEQYLERDDLVKGYEFEKDRYVVMEPEDFEQADGGASRNIEVLAFVEASELKPVHLSKTYYLVPEEGAEKGYALLLEGMRETGKVAITRFVMRGKEYIGSVNFADKGLMLHILFHKGEFKHMEEVISLPEIDLKDKELNLAVQIIENLTEEFSEDMLTDEYRERLMEIIRGKIEGEKVVLAEAPQPAKVIDLMDALKKSLAMSAAKKPAARVESLREEKTQRRKRA